MSKIKDTFFGGAEKKAAKDVQKAQRAAGALTASQLAQTEKEFAPFVNQEAGLSLQNQQALSGALGPDAQREAFAAFEESPGVQFAREQGLRGVESEAAVTGGLGGGQRLRELTKFSQGLALQDFSNQFNRLGITSAGEQAIVGREQQAVTNLANIRAGLGAQQGAAIIGAGQAKGSGRVAQAAGLRAGVAQVAGAVAGGIAGGVGGAGLGGVASGALQGFTGV